MTSKPKLAEEAMRVAPTLGNSEIATELEDNRVFGIEVMERYGIEVPPYEVFESNEIEEAKKFISQNKRKRYVFKPNTEGEEQETASTYVSCDAEDMIEYIDKLEELAHGVEFILQEVVTGTEVSTEGWFNGEEFFLINNTLEEKKFMADKIGPNVGCAGNIVWTYGQGYKLFQAGLEKLKPFLREAGYVGMIDLNTIVSNSHVYGLEWTPRFGYDAAATLFSTISSPLSEFLQAIATGEAPDIRISSPFAASTRLSIPPYPNEHDDCDNFYHEGVPINGIDAEDLEHIFLYDACIENDDLVTAGQTGFVAVPIGTGRSLEEAWASVQARIKQIKIPDVQYRKDLYKCTKKRYMELSVMGYLK